jgi:hypothetical protein
MDSSLKWRRPTSHSSFCLGEHRPQQPDHGCAIREDADYGAPSLQLLVEPLVRVGGVDLAPMCRREVVKSEDLLLGESEYLDDGREFLPERLTHGAQLFLGRGPGLLLKDRPHRCSHHRLRCLGDPRFAVAQEMPLMPMSA